ncbi:response regulator transcription factor [Campylobacter troglodytis]|uniref:response regulator transcription factor n=1 Tax=Campylobacter troglodytis TaxID=654363 RepID=UPI0011586351|nr:response regulator transcription factor [Campylobacter troglodytis]TQR54791.1 DNA-binding response regulator [Campylobacter troglodytis]
MQIKLVLIEDDKDLNELLVLKFKRLNFEVFSFFDTQGVSELLDEQDLDILLVDRNLPFKKDGIDFVRTLRKRGYNEPVIFLTAKALQKDILQGFETGCDDYITKPFDFDELILRIKALVKRNKKESEKLAYKDFLLDLDNRTCFFKGSQIQLSSLEFELLKCFFENKNTLLSREFLAERVWDDASTNDKTINIALTRLRNKFPTLKSYIQSVRGVGYRLC